LLTTFTNPTPAANDIFGFSVAAVGSDRVLMGAGQDDTGAFHAGAAYLFGADSYNPGLVVDEVAPRSITTASLEDNVVTAVKIGGVLFPSQIPDLDASKITGGVLEINRIPNLDASKITAGVLTEAQIPDLDASKITTGTLTDGRFSGIYSSAVTLKNTANDFTGKFSGKAVDSIAAPSFTWDGNPDTGMFQPAANSVGLATAGSERMRITSSGQVGIGTTTPEGDVHIRGNSSTGSLLVTPNVSNSRSQILLTENTTASLGMIIPYAGDEADNPLHIIGWNSDVESSPLLTVERFGGNVGIGIDDPTEKLHVIGNILATGTITPSSDRNLKKNFDSVNPQEVLERVASLPIQQWTYKAEEDAVRHVGPMAQDFHAAFGLGANDTTIATVDADGVALAAIQGLNQKLEREAKEKDCRIAKLEETVNELADLVNELNRQLEGTTR
jgi:hypothetical protein